MLWTDKRLIVESLLKDAIYLKTLYFGNKVLFLLRVLALKKIVLTRT